MIAFVLASMIAASPLEAELRAAAALPGEPHTVAAAGVTRDESPILTIENPAAFDPADTRRRVILIGAPSGDERAAIDAVRWFKTRAPRGIRARWSLSALPLARFEDNDRLSLARWVTFQAPDLIVTVGSVTLQTTVPVESIAVENATAAFAALLKAPRDRASSHAQLLERVQRAPLDVTRLLARRYPETPAISYIPALSWIGALRLAAIDHDDRLRARVVDQTAPWTSGGSKLLPDRVQLTSVAGTMVFAELAADSARAGGASPEMRASAERLFDEGVAAAQKEKAPGMPEYGQGWTDDMFMASAVLARSGARAGHDADLDRAARLLTTYAGRLQRGDGLFNHATDGPAAWGRGNGFAAFGLVETLMRLPGAHPARRELLDRYRRLMTAVRTQQSPDGTWRQIIDEAGAYREETATAMLLSAMARGVRLGWLDGSFRPTIERAWRAVAAHVASDGTLIDVCAGTGAGPTKRYYFDRPALTGADDRGGAMAIVAALDVHDLGRK